MRDAYLDPALDAVKMREFIRAFRAPAKRKGRCYGRSMSYSVQIPQ